MLGLRSTPGVYPKIQASTTTDTSTSKQNISFSSNSSMTTSFLDSRFISGYFWITLPSPVA